MSSPAAMLRKRTQILSPLQKTPYKTEAAKGVTGLLGRKNKKNSIYEDLIWIRLDFLLPIFHIPSLR